jgi:hypothetical protein
MNHGSKRDNSITANVADNNRCAKHDGHMSRRRFHTVRTNLEEIYLQVSSNVWGDQNSQPTQCVFGGVGGLGWRWLKPEFSYQPYFPNLSLNLSHYMPTTVAQLRMLQVVLSAIVRETGTYNLALDVWFSADPEGKRVTDEVMAWLLWTNRTIPLPPALSNGNNNYTYLTHKEGRRFHAFFLLANKIPFLINLERLTRLAGVNGYISSISIGNEVFSGTGETIVYAINIQINDLSIRNAGGCYQLSCARDSTP